MQNTILLWLQLLASIEVTTSKCCIYMVHDSFKLAFSPLQYHNSTKTASDVQALLQQQPQSPLLPQLLPPHPPAPYQPGYPQQVHLPYPTGEVLTMHLHCHTCSLKPRLSSPAFVSQKSNFSPKLQAKSRTESLVRGQHTFTHTHRRRTREVRGAMPPQPLALKVGVVMYLIIISYIASQTLSIIIILSYAIFVRRLLGLHLLNLHFRTYGWLYIILMDLALAQCICAFQGCGQGA